MRFGRYIFCFLTALCLMASPRLNAMDDMGPESLEIKPSVETPHVKWAKPYSSGSVKALLIGPRFGHRETVELWQRMDLDYDVIMTDSFKTIGDSTIRNLDEESVLSRLDAALSKNYDVIIIGNLDWNTLPKETWYRILKKVSEGTGLVYCQFTPDQKSPILDMLLTPAALPQVLSSLPYGEVKELAGANYHAYTLRKGRIMLVASGGGTGFYHYLIGNLPDRTAYEYHAAALVKSVLWASGKASDSKISITGINAGSIDVAVSAGAPSILRLVVRDPDLEQEYSKEIQGGAAGKYSFTLPQLKEGLHYADIALLQDGKVADWASGGFRTVSGSSIESISLDKEYYRPGESASVQVALKSAPAGALIMADLVDYDGRIVYRGSTRISSGQEKASFAVKLPLAGSVMNTLRLGLYAEGRANPLSSRKVTLYMPAQGQQGFALSSWVGIFDFYQGHMLGRLHNQLGFDGAMISSAETGVRPMPYTMVTDYSGTGLVRNPCLTDPAHLSKITATVRDTVKAQAKSGPISYGLGDEPNLSNAMVDVCFSPTCLESFREYARGVYGSVSALNSEWGTSYTGWGDVKPQVRAEAEKNGNLAPWIDHRLHMDSVLTGYWKFVQDEIRKLDKGARSGPEGIWQSTPYIGIDWYGLLKNLGTVIPYDDESNNLGREAVAAWGTGDQFTGTWFGSYNGQINDIYTLTRYPWETLLHNGTSISWFHTYGYSHLPGQAIAGILPDYRLSPGMKSALQEVERIKSGTDRLIMSSRRGDGGIGVLYSRASMYLYGQSHDNILPLLEDIGYQYRMVSTEELEGGILGKGSLKMLILPTAVCLSDREVREIKDFVRSGGVVLADMPPGIFDGHGKKRSDYALTEVFGVRSPEYPFTRGAITVRIGYGEWNGELVTTTSSRLNVAEGKSYGKTGESVPVLITNSFGKGKSVLLNLCFADYIGKVHQGKALPVQSLMDGIMSGAAPKRFADVLDSAGRRVYGYEVIPYFNNADVYLGIMKRRFSADEAPSPVKIALSGRQHVYDTTGGKYLGNVQVIDATLPLGPAAIYTLAGSPLANWSFSLGSKSGMQGGKVLYNIKLAGPEERLRVFRMELINPSGVKVPALSRTITPKGQEIRGDIDLSYNEQPGKWKVQVTDIISGKVASADLSVQENNNSSVTGGE